MNTVGNPTTPWTVARLLAWTQEHLRRGGIESARLCAEILLAHAMGCERLRLYTRHDETPGPEVLDRFRELVREAAGGRPIAYLTGRKEFFSLSFEVTPEVLIPRPETEILVERTIRLVRNGMVTGGDGQAGARPLPGEAGALPTSGEDKAGALPSPNRPAILDLGTGCGCIAVSVAKHLQSARVYASDISEAALAVARRNAEKHGVAERIEFRRGDLLEPWSKAASGGAAQTTAEFDIIVCNPPYVATNGPVEASVRDHEPAGALFAGADGLDVIRRVLKEAPPRVRNGGHLLMEMGYDHAAAVRKLAAEGPWRDVTTYRDGGGHERVLHART